MEKALQDCCRSMRIGKILVDSDAENHEARVIFAKFPHDIAQRKVLLLYPIMNSGNKVCRAVQVLLEHKVPEDHIILINLFSTPKAAKRIVSDFPNLCVLTSEIDTTGTLPNHFGEKYVSKNILFVFQQSSKFLGDCIAIVMELLRGFFSKYVVFILVSRV